MTDLGPCMKRFSPKDRCGIQLRVTPFGPGHQTRPRVSHYPVLSRSDESTSAADLVPPKRPAAVVAAGSIGRGIGIPGVGTPVRGAVRRRLVKAG